MASMGVSFSPVASLTLEAGTNMVVFRAKDESLLDPEGLTVVGAVDGVPVVVSVEDEDVGCVAVDDDDVKLEGVVDDVDDVSVVEEGGESAGTSSDRSGEQRTAGSACTEAMCSGVLYAMSTMLGSNIGQSSKIFTISGL